MGCRPYGAEDKVSYSSRCKDRLIITALPRATKYSVIQGLHPEQSSSKYFETCGAENSHTLVPRAPHFFPRSHLEAQMGGRDKKWGALGKNVWKFKPCLYLNSEPNLETSLSFYLCLSFQRCWTPAISGEVSGSWSLTEIKWYVCQVVFLCSHGSIIVERISKVCLQPFFMPMLIKQMWCSFWKN